MTKKYKTFNKRGPRNAKGSNFKYKKKKSDIEKAEISLLESSKAKV